MSGKHDLQKLAELGTYAKSAQSDLGRKMENPSKVCPKIMKF
jgi:hypothetical protein